MIDTSPKKAMAAAKIAPRSLENSLNVSFMKLIVRAILNDIDIPCLGNLSPRQGIMCHPAGRLFISTEPGRNPASTLPGPLVTSTLYAFLAIPSAPMIEAVIVYTTGLSGGR